MTLELRGSARPTLQQALRWIGSRVDDIYGASIGKLEDIWMDPDSGEPLWLLVRDGRIGGRHTLVPFAQAASGAGHVWIPFEREVVRGAPAVRPSAPLSHELSDTLRRYYAESGHPVGEKPRADDALRATPAPATTAAPEPPRVTVQAAASSSSSSSAPPPPAPPPAMPPRTEPGRHPAWAQDAERRQHAEQPPLPPMPPRSRQPAAEVRFAAPRPAQDPWAAPQQRQTEAPPVRPDQFSRSRAAAPPPQPPPQAAQRPPTPEELRLTAGDGVDMELVGRLQFRGNVVRMQPLRPGATPRA